jgi:RES domain-containing protein
MKFYRFALQKYIHDISGNGAKLYGGRWNSEGNAVVYTSGSPSLAMLEFICNASSISRTNQTSLLTLTLDDKVPIDVLTTNDLPENWQNVPAPNRLKVIGDSWLKESKGLILKVPSAVMAVEFNYLVNPIHKDFKKLKIESLIDMNIDERFFY